MERTPRATDRPPTDSPAARPRGRVRLARRSPSLLRETPARRSSAPRDALFDEREASGAPSRDAGSAGSGAAERYGVSPPLVQNAAPRPPRGNSGGGATPCGDSYHQRLNIAGKIYWTAASSRSHRLPDTASPEFDAHRGRRMPLFRVPRQPFGALLAHAEDQHVRTRPSLRAVVLHPRSDRVFEPHRGRARAVPGVEGGFHVGIKAFRPDRFRPCHDRRVLDRVDFGQLGPRLGGPDQSAPCGFW